MTDLTDLIEWARDSSGNKSRGINELADALEAVASERDAALAVIEQALKVYEHWNWNDFPTKSDEEQFIQVKQILAQSPASALAKVKADAWDEGYERGADFANGVNVGPENPYRK